MLDTLCIQHLVSCIKNSAKNMDYYKILFKTSTETADILTALLSQYPFDAFEQDDNGLAAYIPAKDLTATIEGILEVFSEQFSSPWHKEFIPYKNWNEEWEANFSPILIDDFCAIRASFHAPISTVTHEIVINPKMAFGTGHHETTYMMMQLMEQLDFKNKTVFDFGCGTGILAILAKMLGAAHTLGIDNDPNATENALENIEINQTTSIEILTSGDLATVKDGNWDIILANINRHVILNSLKSLYIKLKPAGKILISGILKQDETLVKQEALNAGFQLLQTVNKNKWICMLFKKG